MRNPGLPISGCGYKFKVSYNPQHPCLITHRNDLTELRKALYLDNHFIVKDTNEQPNEVVHRAKSSRIPSAEASAQSAMMRVSVGDHLPESLCVKPGRLSCERGGLETLVSSPEDIFPPCTCYQDNNRGLDYW